MPECWPCYHERNSSQQYIVGQYFWSCSALRDYFYDLWSGFNCTYDTAQYIKDMVESAKEHARKAKKYEDELCAAIKKHKWMRWAHIDWDALSFSRRTAYEHTLHESHTIKSTLEDNRSKAVSYLLDKWIKSDNATLQIAAMRIVAEEEDRQRLNQQYIDHTTQGEKITVNVQKYDN